MRTHAALVQQYNFSQQLERFLLRSGYPGTASCRHCPMQFCGCSLPSLSTHHTAQARKTCSGCSGPEHRMRPRAHAACLSTHKDLSLQDQFIGAVHLATYTDLRSTRLQLLTYSDGPLRCPSCDNGRGRSARPVAHPAKNVWPARLQEDFTVF